MFSKLALRSAINANDLRSTAISIQLLLEIMLRWLNLIKQYFSIQELLMLRRLIMTPLKKINNNLGNIYCFEKKHDKG
jgi:hypothetical protein